MTTPGKKPTAPSASEQSFTLIRRKTKSQALISGWNPNIWGEDDYCILDNEHDVGRIYREMVQGEWKWRWFLQTDPAPPPNQGMADTLEECAQDFKRRYAQVRNTHGPRRI